MLLRVALAVFAATESDGFLSTPPRQLQDAEPVEIEDLDSGAGPEHESVEEDDDVSDIAKAEAIPKDDDDATDLIDEVKNLEDTLPEASEVETEASEVETEASEVEPEAPQLEPEAPEVETEAPQLETEAPQVVSELPEVKLDDDEDDDSVEEGDVSETIAETDDSVTEPAKVLKATVPDDCPEEADSEESVQLKEFVTNDTAKIACSSKDDDVTQELMKKLSDGPGVGTAFWGIRNIGKLKQALKCKYSKVEKTLKSLSQAGRAYGRNIAEWDLFVWIGLNQFNHRGAKQPTVFPPSTKTEITPNVMTQFSYVACAAEIFSGSDSFISNDKVCGKVLTGVHKYPAKLNEKARPHWYLINPCETEPCNKRVIVLSAMSFPTANDALVMLDKKSSSDAVMGDVPQGFYEAAKEILANLEDFYENGLKEELKGKTLTVVGYSVGAGTGAVLARLIQEQLGLTCDKPVNGKTSVKGVFFGTPPVFSSEQATLCKPSFHSYINENDMVARLTVPTVLRAAVAAKDKLSSMTFGLSSKIPQLIAKAKNWYKNGGKEKIKGMAKKAYEKTKGMAKKAYEKTKGMAKKAYEKTKGFFSGLFKKKKAAPVSAAADTSRRLKNCDVQRGLDITRFVPGEVTLMTAESNDDAVVAHTVDAQNETFTSIDMDIREGLKEHGLKMYYLRLTPVKERKEIYYCWDLLYEKARKFCQQRLGLPTKSGPKEPKTPKIPSI